MDAAKAMSPTPMPKEQGAITNRVTANVYLAGLRLILAQNVRPLDMYTPLPMALLPSP